MADTPAHSVHQPAAAPDSPSAREVLLGAAKASVLRVQGYSKLSYRSLTNLATPPRYLQDARVHREDIGVGSLPIVLLTGFLIGAVMASRIGAQFKRFGQTSLSRDVVRIALVRTLGPSITGLVVADRCASGIASELGSMTVTEQVDTMRAVASDPSRRLVTPRVLAAFVTVPLLTTISVFLGLLGEMVASVFSLWLSATTLWQRALAILELPDLLQGFTKSLVFGFILSIVGCIQGINVRAGIQGIVRGTTQGGVIASVIMIVAVTFLTKRPLYLADNFF